MFDLGPAASRMRALVQGVSDDQLEGPTPCDGWRVVDLLTHVHEFTTVFTVNARREPVPELGGLPDDWRSRLPRELDDLAEAWRSDPAWHGQVSAGGIEMPAEHNALVAVEELVLHGWDLARSTGQDLEVGDDDLARVEDFQELFAQPAGAPDGPYGPPVPVTDGSRLDRVLGVAGRDPAWVP